MSKALRTRIRRNLISLIDSQGSVSLAALAIGEIGVAISGLRNSRPKTTFRFVFTTQPDFIELHERHAGVNELLPSTPSLHLGLEKGERKSTEIRILEDIADLPTDDRWSTRIAKGLQDGEDDIWLKDWLSALMDDCPEAQSRIRRALIKTIDERMLEDIEDAIANGLAAIAEHRYA